MYEPVYTRNTALQGIVTFLALVGLLTIFGLGFATALFLFG